MAEIDIDPKTEIEDKVKVILKLIKDGELDMDGTPEEILKREPLAELVKICEEGTAYQNEISQLAQKNSEQEDELGKLKKELTARTKNCSALQRKLNTAEKNASGKTIEKLREEHAQTLAIVDNEKNELASKIVDLQRTLKEQEDAYQKLNEEYKQVDSKFNECKVNLEVANRKIEEKEESIASKDQIVTDLEHQVEDLKRGLEEKGDEIRTLLENVRNHEEKLQQVQRELEDRNATEVCVDSVKIGIDTVSKKFSDDCNNFDLEKSIANISRELQGVKEHVSEVNSEKEKLQNDNKLLLEELRGNKEHELTLNEKVEKLEIQCKNMEAIRELSLKIVNLS